MIKPIDLDRAYRLLNIGATTLVSAAHEGDADIMAAAWATALDLTPCKATVVIDKSHYTRKLIEKSGFFALMIPTAAIAPIVMNLGTVSKNDNPRKLEECGTRLVTLPEYDMPLLEGCAAGSSSASCPSCTTRKPTICSLVKPSPPLPTIASSSTAVGTSKRLPTTCERCTTWPAAISTPLATRLKFRPPPESRCGFLLKARKSKKELSQCPTPFSFLPIGAKPFRPSSPREEEVDRLHGRCGRQP